MSHTNSTANYVTGLMALILTVNTTLHVADGTYVGTSTLPGMSYGCAYTFGPKAIYIRMDTELIKIGE